MSVNIDDTIDLYVKLRAAIDKINRDAKDAITPLKEKMDLVEKVLRKKIEDLGVESFKGSSGTAFKATKDSVTINDKEGFKTFLAQTMLLNLQGHMYKTVEGDWQPDGEADLTEHCEKLVNSGAFDLLTLSANKNNCKDFMQSNDGLMPKGVDYSKEIVVQIRKASK